MSRTSINERLLRSRNEAPIACRQLERKENRRGTYRWRQHPDRKARRHRADVYYGIGTKFAQEIIEKVGIPAERRVHQLTDAEVLQIRETIDRDYQVEGDLRRETSMNIKRLMDLGCYRGLRHRRGLPVRGQRTHTNARTARVGKGDRRQEEVISRKGKTGGWRTRRPPFAVGKGKCPTNASAVTGSRNARDAGVPAVANCKMQGRGRPILFPVSRWNYGGAEI